MTARRGPGEGSIYRRSDGRWFGALDLGWQGGKRIRKTVSARTKNEVIRKLGALHDDLAAGIVSDGSTTVDAWMTYWLDQIAAKKVRPTTLRTYKAYTAKWITPHLGKHRLDKLTPEHVRALYAAMEKAGKSAATIKQVDAILSRALRIATDEGKIRRNPCASVSVTTPTGSHGKLDADEARKVLTVLAGREDRARWYAALLLGLRQGEALGLAWEDVDLDAGTLHIHQAQTWTKGAGFGLGRPKSATSTRTIPIGGLPEVVAAFKAMPGPRIGLVWGPRHGRADYADWQRLLAAAGVPKRPLHAARATTASLLSEFGVPDKVISEILGHSKVAVTQAHYIHGDPIVHAAALGQLATFMRQAHVARIETAAPGPSAAE